MAADGVLFTRNHVIIKERSPQSEARAAPLDEITGTITVLESERGKFFRFIPLGLEDVMTDEWALVNGGHSVVCYQSDSGQLNSREILLSTRFCYFSPCSRFSADGVESSSKISISFQSTWLTKRSSTSHAPWYCSYGVYSKRWNNLTRILLPRRRQ